MGNRLAQETSPYLLQHKDNPVDWYPWGDEAFERARREDKPILLSVGYAACHWCHVMEHESFEDVETAALMNESFVNVKVDREERPDVDSLYMDAVQAMTGQGGWPMTVFLTPEGAPFYGGTYFPPHDRGGLPSFARLLRAIAGTWRQRRAELRDQGQKLVDHIRDMTRFEPASGDIEESVLTSAFERLSATFDPAYGGFGGAPKFPQPMTVDLLLRLARRRFPEALAMAERTLDAMAAGGMFDQLGGGFHRYAVDRTWTVPHFEKMLYDNAQLLRTYARAWLVTGTARHREVAEATASWMLREMRDPAGGLWSSLDADSEGVEGRFYVWTIDDVRDAAGDDADTAIRAFGMTTAGNFEGHNIPVLADEPDDDESLERARAALLSRREERVRPGTDTKVLAGWNALSASALAEAGAILGVPEWVEAAQAISRFIASELRIDGRLMRSYRQGSVRALGCCDDYALFLEACLVLYETTFDESWLDEARWAADESIRLFLDESNGGFFTTGSDAQELLLRPKDLFDNAVPSGNSVLALELQRLAELTGETSYADHAAGAMRIALRAAAQSPTGFGTLLAAVDFHTSEPKEIVIVGDPEGPDTRALVDTVRARFIPNKVLVVSGGDGEPPIPLLAGRQRANGATAYVCESGVCKLPVTSAAELAAQLDAP
jgi:uncharacterized protein YyaL (SSP411 family)